MENESRKQEPHPLDWLAGYRWIKLTTYRRNGEPVGTPVLFAADDGRIYVATGASSWKVRRIKKNPSVRVEPCTLTGNSLGQSTSGRAKVLSGDEAEAAKRSLLKKHKLLRRIFDLGLWLRGIRRVYLEITVSSSDFETLGKRDTR